MEPNPNTKIQVFEDSQAIIIISNKDSCFTKVDHNDQSKPLMKTKSIENSIPENPRNDLNQPITHLYLDEPPKHKESLDATRCIENFRDGSINSNFELYPSTKFDSKAISQNTIVLRQDENKKNFIRKVYSILATQLVFTIILISLVATVPSIRSGIQFVYPLYYISIFIIFFLIIAIMCFKRIARKYPYNYISLATFTIFESYILAYICSYFNPLIILSALVLAFAVTLALTLYAFSSKSECTVFRGIIVSLISSLITFGIILIFLYNHYVQVIICEIIIIIYSIFIVYDTKRISEGLDKDSGIYDDYIIAALILYVDIIGLFLYILTFLGSKK